MDYEHKIVSVRGAYRHRACRSAVFFPTLGKGWLDDDPAEAFRRLRGVWRARLTELRGAGWQGVSGRKFQYARNCPPFGVVGGDKAQTCQLAKLCPFCWARDHVYKPHTHMEWLLYGDLKRGLPLLDAGATLVEFRFDRRLHAGPGSSWDTVKTDALSKCGRLVKSRADRRFETDHYRHHGGFMLQTVAPGDECLYYRRAGLLLLKAEDATGDSHPEHAKPGTYTRNVHRVVTKKVLSEAVSRVCNYPSGMLTGPVGEVMSVLKDFKGARMLTQFPAR